MQKKEIRAALDALKEIKMPKIEDKALRNDLIANHFALLDAGKKHDAAVEDKRTVFLAAYKDEEAEVGEIQQKLQITQDPVESRALAEQFLSHKDYRFATRAFTDEVDALGKEEVPGLKKIDREKFMAEIEKQDFKLSWVEALYPLFVLEEKKEK